MDSEITLRSQHPSVRGLIWFDMLEKETRNFNSETDSDKNIQQTIQTISKSSTVCTD